MDTPLPYSEKAERALLGSAIIDPGILIEIDLEPADFYVHRNRWIWEALQSLYARGSSPDFVTLTDELDAKGRLEEIGGPAYLAGLVNNTPATMGANQYAEIIKDNAMRRRTILIANTLSKAAYDQKSNLVEVAGQAVDDLTMGIRPKSGALHIGHYLSKLYDEIEERSKDPQAIWGLSTGFLDYDRLTGGLQTGEVLYIAGEPGVGKSILSMQMGFNMAKAGIPGAIYSLEMSGRQVVRRAVSAQAKIETRRIKNGTLEDREWPLLVHAIEELHDCPVYLSDESNLTATALRADLARLKSRHKIQWFVLDYLYLMTDGDGRMDDIERMALLSRRIKAIAKDLELASITVSSVTKDGMDTNKPSKKNMRGPGEVLHAADIIANLLPHQPSEIEAPNKNMRTFTFTKGRELENLTYFHLVKFDRWPAFADYTPVSNNGHKSIEGRFHE